MTEASEQAVLVYLDAIGLPESVYRECDLATLEDRLIEVIDRLCLGEFDGIERGMGEVTLYMYGPDAEALYAGIQPILLSYPLCAGAKVHIRPGGPDVLGRGVLLPKPA